MLTWNASVGYCNTTDFVTYSSLGRLRMRIWASWFVFLFLDYLSASHSTSSHMCGTFSLRSGVAGSQLDVWY